MFFDGEGKKRFIQEIVVFFLDRVGRRFIQEIVFFLTELFFFLLGNENEPVFDHDILFSILHSVCLMNSSQMIFKQYTPQTMTDC